MTTPEPLSEAEIADHRRYSESRMIAPDHWSPSEIDLAKRTLRWIATIDALTTERDRLRAIVDSHLSAQSDLDALGVMTARAQAAEERADGWESLIAGSAEATEAVVARLRQIEDWRRRAERAEAAEAAFAEAVKLLRRHQDDYHVVRPCHCEFCEFLAAWDASEDES